MPTQRIPDELASGPMIASRPILEAISVLDDILRRMERHHRKQRLLLARLRAADYVHTKR
jgi:hypothetical protein